MPRSVDRVRDFYLSIPLRERSILGGAMVLSLTVVVVYVLFHHGQPLAGDELEYEIEGRFFADGHLWWTTTPFGIAHATAWKAPLYPAWVGIWYAILGDSPGRVELVQAFIAPLTVALTWLLARRLYSPRVALASAVVVAVFPLVWELFGLLYSEALAIPLSVGALLLFLGRRDVTPGRAIAVGALLGVDMLVRPTSVAFFAGVLASFVIATGWRRGLGLSALAGLIAALVIAPWTIRNYFEYDAFLPISIQDTAIAGTFNGEAAHDPVNPYGWRANPPADRAVYKRRNAVDDAALQSKLRRIAFDYIERHPESVAEAFFWNGLSRFWDIRRPSHALDEVPFEGRSRTVGAVGLAMYYALLPLTIAGLWRARRRRELFAPVIAIAIALSIVFTAVSGTRYRAPIEPLIVILACGAVLTPRVRAGPNPVAAH